MELIDLKSLFTDSVCSFEAAKKARASGFSCANTFFAYDDKGEVTDGGAWLEDIFNEPDKFFPCINIAMAVSLLGDTDLDSNMILLFRMDKGPEPFDRPNYVFQYNGKLEFTNTNLADLLIDVWIRYKKPRT